MKLYSARGACHPLSPRDRLIGIYYEQIGLVHLLQSRTDEAITWLEKARNALPAHSIIRAQLASTYAIKGETDRAFAELAEARKLSLDDRYSSIVRLKAVVGYWGVPKIRDLFEATYFAGCARAACRRIKPGLTGLRLHHRAGVHFAR